MQQKKRKLSSGVETVESKHSTPEPELRAPKEKTFPPPVQAVQ
jgi:hypothetical protein